VNSEILTKANQGLVERVNDLSAQVARQEKQLKLCLEVISQFGHFVPNIVKEFENELIKLEEESYDDVKQERQGDSEG
jgi:hypothetical protein|tara:strand:- start:1723 stop:1956 length:234 start_codon:yes stop_codon:yes gene_type:complete